MKLALAPLVLGRKLESAHTRSYSTGFVSAPIFSISTVTVSPARNQLCGFRAMPTPCGVPVMITVPGNSVVLPRPSGGRWREVSIHESAGAGLSMDLQDGDRVRHPKWGEGTIRGVAGAGGDGLITIDFPNVGQKMLMLKYAPLEKI